MKFLFLFLQASWLSTFYSGLMKRGLTDDKKYMSTIPLTKYVYMTGARLVAIAKDGSCPVTTIIIASLIF